MFLSTILLKISGAVNRGIIEHFRVYFVIK